MACVPRDAPPPAVASAAAAPGAPPAAEAAGAPAAGAPAACVDWSAVFDTTLCELLHLLPSEVEPELHPATGATDDSALRRALRAAGVDALPPAVLEWVARHMEQLSGCATLVRRMRWLLTRPVAGKAAARQLRWRRLSASSLGGLSGCGWLSNTPGALADAEGGGHPRGSLLELRVRLDGREESEESSHLRLSEWCRWELGAADAHVTGRALDAYAHSTLHSTLAAAEGAASAAAAQRLQRTCGAAVDGLGPGPASAAAARLLQACSGLGDGLPGDGLPPRVGCAVGGGEGGGAESDEAAAGSARWLRQLLRDSTARRPPALPPAHPPALPAAGALGSELGELPELSLNLPRPLGSELGELRMERMQSPGTKRKRGDDEAGETPETPDAKQI